MISFRVTLLKRHIIHRFEGISHHSSPKPLLSSLNINIKHGFGFTSLQRQRPGPPRRNRRRDSARQIATVQTIRHRLRLLRPPLRPLELVRELHWIVGCLQKDYARVEDSGEESPRIDFRPRLRRENRPSTSSDSRPRRNSLSRRTLLLRPSLLLRLSDYSSDGVLPLLRAQIEP